MVSDIKILVVDDDPTILRLLELVLKGAHYSVYSTASGEKVPHLIQELQPDLIMLDIELPDSSGIELVPLIRQHTHSPIMMVSGKNSDVEKISSFNSGADDYVVKPFSVGELIARIQAILRRSKQAFPPAPPSINPSSSAHLPIYLAADQRRAYIGELELSLTQKEFHLLQLLIDEKGKALSRETILDKIWGINNVSIETRAVDACVSRLRIKVKSVLGKDVIEAVPGFGYRLHL